MLWHSVPDLFSFGFSLRDCSFFSYNLAEDSIAPPHIQHHPSSSQAVPACSVHASEQTRCVCPAPQICKKEKIWEDVSWESHQLPSNAWPGQLTNPSPEHQSWNSKRPPVSHSSSKPTKLSSKRPVLSVNSRLQPQREGLICNPRYHRTPPPVPPVPAFCRQQM